MSNVCSRIMGIKNQDLDAIEFNLKLMTTPGAVYRAVTSQTELRRWWAPRVIMSRFIVSQEESRDMEMRPLAMEKDHLVRYTWRGKDWDKSIRSTIITFEIEDLGVSRGSTGEGIQLRVIHDGWSDPVERERQEKIWDLAIKCLDKYLKGVEFSSWWDDNKNQDGFRQVQLGSIKQFAEKMDQESKGKAEKKLAARCVLDICLDLDGLGSWHMKDNRNEFELRFQNHRVFGIQKNGNMLIGWRDLEKILGDQLPDYASRLTVEQDVDLHIGKSQDRLPLHMINAHFWAAWCKDVIEFARGKS